MVSTANIIAIIVIGLICLIVPIISLIILKKKSSKITGAFFAGVLSFYILQMIIRIPIIQLVLPKFDWYNNLEGSILLFALFLGFTAAIFEGVGRFFTIKYVLRDRKSYFSGISHGIGHGGIEMIILISINYIVYVFIAFQINNGAYDIKIAEAIISSGAMVGNQMVAIKNTLINTSTFEFFIVLVERMFTFIIQIGLSLMIMEGIIRKKEVKFFLLVILIHTALDSFAVILSFIGVEVILIELMIAGFAGFMLYYIISSKKRFEGFIYPVEEDENFINSNY